MFSAWFRTVARAVVEDFYGELARLPRSRRVLDMLSGEELDHLKSRQVGHLCRLAEADLTLAEREATARHIGRVHAVVGVEQDELAIGRGLVMASVHGRMAHAGYSDPMVATFAENLADDLSWQLQAYQDIEQARQEVLQRLTKATWAPGTYLDLINKVVEILAAHGPIAGCAIGRPDGQGVFHFEAAASRGGESYAAGLLGGAVSRIVVHADQPGGQGPVGRAWRSGQAERIINFSTDPQAEAWRAFARRNGLRSCIAVPLGAQGGQPLAVLLAHSGLPGGFISLQQTAFFDMVQTLLGSAFARLDEVMGIRAAIPFAARNRLAALVRSDALCTYYQPILDLRSWKVTKVEALARLQDGERLLAPGEFIDVLKGDDLIEVFAHCLHHALADRRNWLAAGIELDISINLPPAALSDIRYYEAVGDALAAHACPAGRLTLEVLENEEVSLSFGRQTLLAQFRALGVQLAQDDLGAGHSGLARLRRLPFDLVKIDRDMLAIDGPDPLPTLRFVYQLTRLGHALGSKVVAEGVESDDLLAALALLGVDAGQGYAIGKPMPEPALRAWLAGSPPERCAAAFGKGVLARLAKLLVWSDRLALDHRVLRDPAALRAAAGPEAVADGEALLRALTALHGMPPQTPDEARAQRRLVEAAVQHGPESERFGQAFRRLAAVIQGNDGAARGPSHSGLHDEPR